MAACSGEPRTSGDLAAETALLRYDSCDALESDLKQMLIDDIETHFDMERSGKVYYGWEDTANGPPRAEPSTTAERQEGKDYSGTNNQKEGVDEADFVKTDGYHIYVLNGNQLHVFGVPVFGQLVPESTFDIEGWPREMLLDKQSGRVAVFSMLNPWSLPVEHPLRARVASKDLEGNWIYRIGSLTKVTVIDAANRSAPKLARELYLEADYQTARLVDRSVRVGAYSWMSVPSVDRWLWWYYGDGTPTREQREAAAKAAVEALRLEDLVPQIYERLPDRTFNTHALAKDGCRSFHRPTDSHGRGVTSLLTIDLASTLLAIDADQILSNHGQIFASQDYLYVAELANDWWWFWWNPQQDDVTNLHAFDISQPGETRYVGSGRVAGQVNNQFSMDEKDGIFRVVTTTDRFARWWIQQNEQPPSENHVFTLRAENGKLEQVGRLDGLAKGERVWSARFSGDRAYVVTFRNVDPLFVVDLRNPAAPRVLGELKVPGVSTYLQELTDRGLLLAIGYGGDDDGLNWQPQISLFDVRNPEDPGLIDVEKLGTTRSWSWTEALYEHKAFQYWAPKKLLAIPLSSVSNDIRGYGYDVRSTLELINVHDDGLSSYGRIDHSPYYNRGDRLRYWLYSDVRRSIFMGEFIYAISDAGISVHKLADLGLVAEALLPGFEPTDLYWWW